MSYSRMPVLPRPRRLAEFVAASVTGALLLSGVQVIAPLTAVPGLGRSVASAEPPPPPSYRDRVLASSPAGYWRLGEAPGSSTMQDASGNGRHGVYTGASLGRVGRLVGDSDTAFGTTVHAANGRASLPDFGPSVGSVETWFRTQRKLAMTVVSTGYPSGALSVLLTTSGTAVARANVAGATIEATGTEFMATGEWHHAAAVYDGTQLRLFVDGAEVASTPASGALTWGSSWLDVGQAANCSNCGIIGDIDEVALYDRPLSPAELAERISLAGVLEIGCTITDAYSKYLCRDKPVGYWRLDEADSGAAAPFGAYAVTGRALNSTSLPLDGDYLASPNGAERPRLGMTGLALGSTSTSASFRSGKPKESESQGPSMEVRYEPYGRFGSPAMTLEAYASVSDRGPWFHEGWIATLGGSTGRAGIGVSRRNGNRPTAYLKIDGVVSTFSAPFDVPEGVVLHYALTYDGVAGRLFVSGSEVARLERPGRLDPCVACPLGLGRPYNSTGNGHLGLIDEVAYYSRALPPARIGSRGLHVPVGQTIGGSDCSSAEGADPTVERADPVNTATGALSESFVDVVLPGVGITCAFTRSYTSIDTTDGPLGVGWTHPYNASVSADADGDVTFRAEDGQQVVFTKQPDGSFVGAAGVRSTLAPRDGGGYRVTTTRGTTLLFNTAGQMTSKKNRMSQGLEFGYTAGDLTAITDAAGRTVTLSYAGGRLDRVTLPDGRYVDYGFTDGRLTSVRDLRGQTTTYEYDAGGRLAAQIDPLGHYAFRNTYDPSTGRVVEQIDAAGQTTRFAWNPVTQTSEMTDPRGMVWTDQYFNNVLMSSTDPLGNTTSHGYDASLNTTSVTDARGKITTMTYDARGNLLTRTAPAPLSYVERFTYTADNDIKTYTDGRGNLAMSNTFDETTGLLSTSTDGEGGVTRYTYTSRGQIATITDPRGKGTSFGYDADGNRTSITSPTGAKTTMTYDQVGRLKTTVDPRGNVAGADPATYTTAYDYNAGDALTKITNARGYATTFDYDDAGRRTSITDALTRVTRFDYDDANRVTKVTDARGAVTTTAYDTAGNVMAVTTPAGKTTFVYDAAGRPVFRVDPRGNVPGATAADFTWTFRYDEVGNRVSVEHPTGGTTATSFDAVNRPTVVTDPLGRAVTTTYDANSNAVAFVNALGHRTETAYDKANRRVTVTDARGKATRYTYDEAGLRTSETTPLGFVASWSYDDDGRVVKSVDPRGNVAGGVPGDYTTTFGYDAAGNQTSVTDPLGHVTRFAYDAVSNLTAETDAKLRVTRYSYDALDRLGSVTGADGAVTAYGYDEVGNLTSRRDARSHTTGYGFDLAGRLTSTTSPTGQRWNYGYDAAGNRTSVETPAGSATATVGDGLIGYTYDALDRLTGVDYSDGTPDVGYAYDGASRRVSITDGAGTESYGYDNADRLTRVSRGGAAFEYGYDAVANVTRRNYPDGTVVDYGYDGDGRMVSVGSGAAATSYGYDPAGNLLTTTLPSGNGHLERRSYDPAGWLTELANTRGSEVLSRFEVARDAVGNPLSVTTTRGSTVSTESYLYDAVDRLQQVCYDPSCAGSDEWIDYTYDRVGNRTSEVRRVPDPSPPPAAVPAPIASSSVAGKCAQTTGVGNSAVVLADCSGQAGQQWTAEDDGTVRAAGACLEIPWGVTAEGTQVRVNPCNAMSHQRWVRQPSGELLSTTSGRCLTVPTGGGTQLVVSDCTGDAGQLWTSPEPPGGPVGMLSSVGAPSKCAQVSGSSRVGNTPALLTECRGAQAQYWTMVDDGTIRSLGMCLEIPWGVTAEGTGVRINPCNQLSHQLWTRQPDGQLRSESSGRCLSIAGAVTGNPQLVVSDCAAAAQQQWRSPAGRQHLSTASYGYNNADQLTSSTVDGALTTYSYDPNGNQTRVGGVTSAFDLAGRTTSTTVGGSTTAFTYDGSGRRVTASTGGAVTTRYLWDPNHPLPQLAAETDDGGGLLRRYVTGVDGPVSLTTGGGTTGYYHRDGFGSISDVTSATGVPLWAHSYEPYGRPRVSSKLDPAAPENPLRYTGQYLDAGSGQYHLRARQYDPASGRFTATDPLTPPLADPYVSAYAYANNRPTAGYDPAGESFCPFGHRADDSCNLGGALGDTGSAIIGVRNSAVAVAREFRHAATNPIQTFEEASAACWAGVDQYRGDSLAGWAKCLDNVNPQAGWRESYRAGWQLAQAGCVTEASEALSRAPLELARDLALTKAAMARRFPTPNSAAKAGPLKGPIADQVARNLPEQMALESARSGAGRVIIENLGDAPRLVAHYGPGQWVKMENVVRGIDGNVTVHWFRNLTSGQNVEFKFTSRYGG